METKDTEDPRALSFTRIPNQHEREQAQQPTVVEPDRILGFIEAWSGQRGGGPSAQVMYSAENRTALAHYIAARLHPHVAQEQPTESWQEWFERNLSLFDGYCLDVPVELQEIAQHFEGNLQMVLQALYGHVREPRKGDG